MAEVKLDHNPFFGEKGLFISSITLVTLFCVPYLIFGKDSTVTINDSLDSIFVWYKVILDTKTVFAPNNSIIPPFMNGITRASFPSEFNFTMLWFWIFGPVNAYIFERFLLSYVAFLGMLLLLRNYIIKDERFKLIQYGVAVSFALLPHWPFGGMCVPGLPLVMFSFMNLLNERKNLSNWIIIAVYTFYSSLVTSGLFLIGLLMLIVIAYLLKHKKIPVLFCLGIFMLVVFYLISHYRLFLLYFSKPRYISHRVEFVRETIDFSTSFKNIIHGLCSNNQVVLGTILLYFIYAFKRNEISGLFIKVFSFIFVSLVLVSLLDSIYLFKFTTFLFKVIPVNLERISWLYPLLWMIIFAISLSYFTLRFKYGKQLVIGIFAIQFLANISKHEILVTSVSIKSTYPKIEIDPSFRSFFAENQFSEIAKHIGKEKQNYRVLSLGMHPSIAQYNGFYTLDGYASIYKLEYKDKFRKIIKEEIKKNPAVDDYFEKWGSRVYLLTSENIGYMNQKNNNIVLPRLDFNYNAIKQLNGQYIFSAVKLNEQENPLVHLEKKFTNSESAWDIYLYKIL